MSDNDITYEQQTALSQLRKDPMFKKLIGETALLKKGELETLLGGRIDCGGTTFSKNGPIMSSKTVEQLQKEWYSYCDKLIELVNSGQIAKEKCAEYKRLLDDIYNYFVSKGVDIFSDVENFDGSCGIMAYNKTEQKRNKANKERDILEWIVSTGKHKGVVSGAKWIEVQELLTANEDKRYRKPTKNNSLLSGLIRCSKCGSYMRPKLKTNYTADGELRFDYMCELKEKSRKQKCDCKNINGNEADKLVMQTIKELVAPNSTFRKKLSSLAKNKFDGASKDTVELKALETTLKKNEQAIENLLDRIKFIDIALLEDITAEIKKLKADNLEIEKRIAELKSIGSDNVNTQDQAQIVLNIIDSYFTTFDTLDLTTRRNLLRIIISSIQSDGEDLELNLIGVREESVRDNVPLCEDSK